MKKVPQSNHFLVIPKTLIVFLQRFFTIFWEQFHDPNMHYYLIECLYSLRKTQSVHKYALDFENLVQKTI